jgi:hypothetical protein
VNRGLQKGLQERLIELAKLLAQPKLARQGLFEVKSIGSRRIEDQAKAQLDDEQGMPKEKTAQLSSEGHPFANANKEGFEVGAHWMGRASARGTLGFPLFNDRPVEQSKEGAVVGDEWVMIEQCSHGGLVKKGGSRYHSSGLLLLVSRIAKNTLQKEPFLCQGEKGSQKRRIVFSRNELLALEIRQKRKERESGKKRYILHGKERKAFFKK